MTYETKTMNTTPDPIAPDYPYNNDNRNLIDHHLMQIKNKLDMERQYIQELESEVYRLNTKIYNLRKELEKS